MAWTAPTTRNPGDLITASIWNTDLVNNLLFLKTAPGTRIVSATRSTGTVSTTGTTFAGGADLLSSALSFTADGTSTYIVRVSAASWLNSSSTGANELRLNLDGSDVGVIARATVTAANQWLPLTGFAPFTPSAGSHTVNARIVTPSGGGTLTVQYAAGGAGNYLPIFVAVEYA